MIKKCNCSTAYVFSFGFSKKCLTYSEINCIYDQVYKNIDNVLENCVECPLECDSKRYMVSTSSGEFPTPRYANDLINSTFLKTIFSSYSSNRSSIKSSVLSFTVYYSELKYTEIRELEKFTPIDLLTSIGI